MQHIYILLIFLEGVLYKDLLNMLRMGLNTYRVRGYIFNMDTEDALKMAGVC